MSVVVETTLGDITVDLFTRERPRACQNFLKLCKIKYYNFNLFHTVSRRFIAQTGDPTGSRNGGESIFGVLDGPLKRFFVAETNPRIKHTVKGLISFVGNEENMIGSQFFFTLGDDLTYLDGKHCVFGEVAEGLDVLELINEAICDSDDRPYQDIRITHTVVLDDPLPDLDKMVIPSRSPSPSAERLQGGRIAPDEEIDDIAGKSAQEINEMIAEREAKARATILEMVGDLPDADMAPPENVLFVCKLNPVTSDDDLEIIFSRFGKIVSCEVIRDHKTGDSLQYAFIEFEDKKSCEDAYFKMDNVLIDDRRIHVDFSQSVSKVKWMGKGRGVKHFPENGNKEERFDREKQSREYKKPERKDFSSGKYDNGSRHHRKNRTPSPSRKKNNRYRRSRSKSPKTRKIERNRSRSSSPQYRKQDRREKSYERRSRSPPRKYKHTKNRSESRSVSPRDKTSKYVDKRYKSKSKYKKTENRHRSSSRESRSISPANKKSKNSSKNRKNRSPSDDNDRRRIKSPSRDKSKSDKEKKSRTRRSRSKNRGSDRSQSPEIKKSKTSRNKTPPKHKKNRGGSSDRSASSSPEYKKSKSRRNRSSSSENRKKPKRYRSSSSDVEERKHHKGKYKKK